MSQKQEINSSSGIIYCSFGWNLKYSRSPAILQKTNCDFSSIHGCRCSRKQNKRNTWAIRRFSKDVMHKKDTVSHWRSTILAERKLCFFDRELNQNPKYWILRVHAVGSQKPLRQRPEFAAALKQCIKMQDAHLAETQQFLRPIRPEHQQRQRQDQQFEGGENFDHNVDWKIGWRYYRKPWRNPPAASLSSTSQWQTSQWQTSWSSWQSTSSEKWWCFRFHGRNSRKSKGGVDRTFTHNTRRSSTVCSQAQNAHTTRWTQELHFYLCAPDKSVVIWRVPCLIFGCLTCLSPRALHLPHSLFLLRHKNTQEDRYNKSKSENTPYIPHISKFPQSTSCTIKNHSGVKTCRVAETRAPQLPHQLSNLWERWRTAGRKSLDSWSPVRSWCLCSRFPKLGSRAKRHLFG